MTDISLKLGVVKSNRRHLKAPPREALDRARASLGLI